MSTVIQDRVGSITRNTAGEVDIKLFVYKNRRKKRTTKGDADLSSFLRGFEIYESISNQIIKELMGKKYINTAKKLYLEKTLNKQTFISPNWRPFDLIYWMSQRSIRKSGRGQQLQNGFAFFENALGFHYKSIDSMINLANNQDTKPTNPNTEMGDVKMYTYTYTPKAFTDPSNAQFSISAVSFPKERNFLMGLRLGNFSGYSV